MQSHALSALEEKADQAADFLKLLANERRLLILCHLAAHGEMTVNVIADAIGLGQSASSQHLARLRNDGLVTYRREAQTVFYRVADPKVVRLLRTLRQIFCP
jgi:DNA-binding transcriptional ArsR family regulator